MMCTVIITEGRNGVGVVVKMCRGAVRHMILMKEDSREIREEKTTPRNFPAPVSLSPIRCLHALSSAKDIVWKENTKVNNSTQQY